MGGSHVNKERDCSAKQCLKNKPHGARFKQWPWATGPPREGVPVVQALALAVGARGVACVRASQCQYLESYVFPPAPRGGREDSRWREDALLQPHTGILACLVRGGVVRYRTTPRADMPLLFWRARISRVDVRTGHGPAKASGRTCHTPTPLQLHGHSTATAQQLHCSFAATAASVRFHCNLTAVPLQLHCNSLRGHIFF